MNYTLSRRWKGQQGAEYSALYSHFLRHYGIAAPLLGLRCTDQFGLTACFLLFQLSILVAFGFVWMNKKKSTAVFKERNRTGI